MKMQTTSPWCAQVLDDDPDLLGVIEMPYARSEFRDHRHPPAESIQRGAVLLRQLFERVRLNAEFVVLHDTCFQIAKSQNGRITKWLGSSNVKHPRNALTGVGRSWPELTEVGRSWPEMAGKN